MIKSFKQFISEGSIRVNYMDSYGGGYDFEYYDQPKKKKNKFEKKDRYKANKASEVKLDSTDSILVRKQKNDS